MAFFTKPQLVWEGKYSDFEQQWPNLIAVMDINGDGRLDILNARFGGVMPSAIEEPLQVLIQTRDGRFRDQTASMISGPQAVNVHPRELVLADFNGDGKDDVFIGDHGYDAEPFPGAQNTLLLSNSKGLTNVTSTNLPQVTDFTHGVAAGDIDGDGDIDILECNIPNQNGNPIPTVLVNNGLGSFALGNALPLATNMGFSSSALGDIDNDGDNDIIMGGGGPTNTAILLNDGHGQFAKSNQVLPPKALGIEASVYDIQIRDLNHDGFNDMILLYTGIDGLWLGNEVNIWLNDGTGNFIDDTQNRISYSNPSDSYAMFIEMADFNGDGVDDMLLHPDEGFDQILLDNGDGVFFRPAKYQFSFGFRVETADFNNDGKQDVMSWTNPNEMVLYTWDDGPKYPLNGNAKANTLYGDARSNKMNGFDGSDTIFSGAGNDRIVGSIGDDTMCGGSGNDRIDGSAGTADTAVFNGNRASYSIVQIEGGLQIQDNRALSPDGTDIVLGVEFLRFADGTMPVDGLF